MRSNQTRHNGWSPEEHRALSGAAHDRLRDLDLSFMPKVREIVDAAVREFDLLRMVLTCKRGHPYTYQNRYRRKGRGGTYCRICKRERDREQKRERRQRERAAA